MNPEYQAFRQWFYGANHRTKYSDDSSPFLAAWEAWQASSVMVNSSWPWMGIQSAPKDARMVVVADSEDWCQAWYWKGSWHNEEGELYPQPTHWMPVPYLPKAETSKGAE